MSRERTPQVGRGGCCWLLFWGGMGSAGLHWAVRAHFAGPVALASLCSQPLLGMLARLGCNAQLQLSLTCSARCVWLLHRLLTWTTCWPRWATTPPARRCAGACWSSRARTAMRTAGLRPCVATSQLPPASPSPIRGESAQHPCATPLCSSVPADHVRLPVPHSHRLLSTLLLGSGSSLPAHASGAARSSCGRRRQPHRSGASAGEGRAEGHSFLIR